MALSGNPIGTQASKPWEDAMDWSFDDASATLWRIRGEYREMPGLKLTVTQAARLWQLDPPSIERLLNLLVADGLLRRTAAGAYLASSAEQRAAS
jgi:hypothetical protein